MGIPKGTCNENETLDTSNSTGNTAVGRKAMESNTDGYWNTAFGNNALASNTTNYQEMNKGLTFKKISK